MGRAIVRQPQVFLFDEPLSNLDAKLRAQTRLEIQKLHRELGITSLFVTHDQVEAMTLAQRMIVMNAGVMEQFGTPEEVYHSPASTFVASFIGSPPMNLLKNAPGARAGTIMGVRPEHLDIGSHRLGAARGNHRAAGRRTPDLHPPGRRAGHCAQRRRHPCPGARQHHSRSAACRPRALV
jgi:ABC-type sugar transport system ATPase subunit